MKAVFLTGIKKIEVKEIQKPVVGNDEALLKVKSCTICGSNLRIFKFGHRKIKYPWIMGHEISGIIENIGDNVKSGASLKIGDRVSIVPGIACRKCDWCLKGKVCPNAEAIEYDYPGGFSQYFVIPASAVANNVIQIPDNVDFTEASIAEPLACVINGQEIMGDIPFKRTAVIIGAGSIGVMHAKLLKNKGVSRIIISDIVNDKLKLAKKVLGNDYIYNNNCKNNIIKVIQDLTNGMGVDIVIVACSSKIAQEEALKIIGLYGKILYFGGLQPEDHFIKFDSNLLHYKLAGVFGTYSSTVYQQKLALKLISTGFTKGVVTHRFPFSKIRQAFDLSIGGKGLKIAIEPWKD